ncbi:MAG: hypothetical protein MK008_05810 [Bdellovibrionales bacterium]|nr:hypothetical protein [Bdellovibrionales bacterium]
MKYLIALILLLTACHSPINHRLTQDNSELKKLKLSKEFKNNKLMITFEWIVGPSGDINKNNSLFVVVKDENNNLVNIPKGLNLSFYATMPSMGHPLDDAGFFEPLSKGLYLNQTIKYNMGGQWLNELWLVDEDLNIKDKISWQDTL